MSDLYNPFDAIYANTERLRQLTANQAAGRQYAAGNYQGAANALATSGDLQGAQQLVSGQQEQQLRAAQAENYKSEALARQLTAQQTFLSGVTPRLKSAYDQAEQVRPGSGAGVVAQAYTNYLAPGLKARGVQDDELARYGELAKDPNTFFNTLGSIAQEKVDWSVVGGELIGHTASGKIVQRTKAGRIGTLKDPTNPDGSGGVETVGWLDPEAAAGQTQPQPPPPPPEGAVPAAAGGFDAFKAAIRGQEAPAGQAGVGIAGPPTAYGQAHGQMQVLDSTGEGTAKRLGIAWRPDLMRGRSPEAAAYQDQIGTAVAQDAWQQGHGDPATAAALYFAGPNHALWGPKTHQYQQDIISRMGAPEVAQASQQASASVPVPGFTPITRSASRPAAPKPAPAGYQWSGDRLAPIPGGPADRQSAAPIPFSADPKRAETFGISPGTAGYFDPKTGEPHIISGQGQSLKPPPAKVQQGYQDNNAAMKQIDEAISLVQQRRDSFGLKNMAGDAIMQRMDPAGVDARAAIANIGSLIIHDRSGAAVSVSEGERLKPFIPAATDTPDAILRKLKGLRRQYENKNSEAEVAYGEGSGFRPLGGGSSGQAPQARPGQRFPRQRGWTRNLPAPQLNAMRAGRWDTNAPPGTQNNPIVITSADEYAKVHPNEYFIDSDGQKVQKH